MQSKPIIVVQGAQWGSEAKGAFAAALCNFRQVTHVVRTGTVNAGHTVYFDDRAYKMQQLPTGWASGVGPNLIIGAGAYIHPEILAREINEIYNALDATPPILVDSRCGLHLPIHTERSAKSGRHHSMGATGKGCSEAVISKLNGRGGGGRLFRDWMDLEWDTKQKGSGQHWSDALSNIQFIDTAELLNSAWDSGAQILVEGTQGTFLDLHLGPYPYTTHKQTQTGSWLAECGLSPALPVEVALIARTFPIRVAGNSGPMPREISWVKLARRINDRLRSLGLGLLVQDDSLRAFEEACDTAAHMFWTQGKAPATTEGDYDWEIEDWSPDRRAQFPIFVSELHKTALEMVPGIVKQDLCRIFEMTTVTNKLRRVAELDLEMLVESIMLNRPAYLSFSFMNYLFPETWNCDWISMSENGRKGIERFAEQIEKGTGTPVRYISTGPKTEHVLEVGA